MKGWNGKTENMKTESGTGEKRKSVVVLVEATLRDLATPKETFKLV